MRTKKFIHGSWGQAVWKKFLFSKHNFEIFFHISFSEQRLRCSHLSDTLLGGYLNCQFQSDLCGTKNMTSATGMCWCPHTNIHCIHKIYQNKNVPNHHFPDCVILTFEKSLPHTLVDRLPWITKLLSWLTWDTLSSNVCAEFENNPLSLLSYCIHTIYMMCGGQLRP